MPKRMRPGNVVTVRVNPRDCMAVVDLVHKAGVYIPGMSFSAMVSLALASSLQTFRDNGLLPERDGYEYQEIVGPYISNNNGRKLEITKAVQAIGSEMKIAGISHPVAETHETAVAGMRETTAELREAGRRLGELINKKDLAEQGVEGILWSASDEREYKTLYSTVYPEG